MKLTITHTHTNIDLVEKATNDGVTKNKLSFEKKVNAWDAKRRLNGQSGAVVMFAKLVAIPDIIEGTNYDYTQFDIARNDFKKMASNLITDSQSLSSVGGPEEMSKLIRTAYGNTALGLLDIFEKAKSPEDQRSKFRDITRSLINNDFNSVMITGGSKKLDQIWMNELSRLAQKDWSDKDNSEIREHLQQFIDGDSVIFEK